MQAAFNGWAWLSFCLALGKEGPSAVFEVTAKEICVLCPRGQSANVALQQFATPHVTVGLQLSGIWQEQTRPQCISKQRKTVQQ